MVDVESLVWDEWNLTHIGERHSLRPEAVEDVCYGEHVSLVSYKQRIMLIGRERSGQILTVIIGQVPNRPGTFYVFSARPASRKERRYFAESSGTGAP